MKDLYIAQEFVHQINLKPADLNRRLISTIQSHVTRELNGRCVRGIGHIKPGSVQIVKIGLGKYVGAHLTGNMTFSVTVKCQAAQPVVGKTLICKVIAKNEAGVVGRNFMCPFVMFIPRIEGDEGDLRLIDSLKLDSTIEVIVRDFVLKPPNKDRPYPEYWIICKISQVDLETGRLTALTRVNVLPDLRTWLFVKGDVKAYDRSAMTERWYDQLESTKNMLDTHINRAYADALMKMEHPENDFMVRTQLDKILGERAGESMFVGVILDDSTPNPDGRNHNHRVHVIYSRQPAFKVREEYTIKAGRPAEKNDVAFYTVSQDGSILRVKTYNLWSAHVRNITNPYEQVRSDNTFDSQLVYLSKQLGDRTLMPPRPDGSVSRAYYKMFEMLGNKDFEHPILPMHERPVRVLSIAESPGGFLQSLMQYRYGIAAGGLTKAYSDEFVGMSISPGTVRGASLWGDDIFKYVDELRDRIMLAESAEPDAAGRMRLELVGDWVEGLPEAPGDLFFRDSREGIVKGTAINRAYRHNAYTIEDGADLVTADGGFEHDKRANLQEVEMHKLVLAEVVTAMRCQRHGGNFVLKIFDISTVFTANLVSILCGQYNHCYIYKPKSSRPANSEKYLVCQDYDPQPGVVEALTAILDDWQDDTYIDRIFENSAEIKEAITHYNSAYMQKQVEFLTSAIDYASIYLNTMGSDMQHMQAKILEQQAAYQIFFGKPWDRERCSVRYHWQPKEACDS